MPSNDLVILDQVLAEQRTSVSPEMDDAKFFEAFTAEQILKDRDVSWDDIESGIIGGGGDGGIDSAYLFLNGLLVQEDTDLTSFSGNITLELVLLQSKRSARFSESTVQTFHASLKDLLDLTVQPSTLASTYHAEIIRFFERFHEAYKTHAAKLPDLSLAISYATRGGNPSSNVTRQVSNVRDAVEEHFRDADFSFEFVGAARLLELVRRRPRTSFGLPFKEDITGAGGNVALVKLTDFKDFITAETGALNKAMFDANVRDHQGDVTVNKSIRDSLEHPGDEDFWWLNNGITIVADNITAAGKKYTIENPQIVNGLQTSFELFSHFGTTSEGDDRCLLVRVISPEHPTSYEKIIRATNSQTSIPFASLKATDKIHRDIEDFLGPNGFYYERRKNFYKNEGKPSAKIVTIPHLAQATMAVLLGRPNDARARPSTLLKRQEDYERVFSEDYPLDVYHRIIAVQKKAEAFLRVHPSALGAKDVNNLRFYVSYAVVRRALNKVHGLSPNDVETLELQTITPTLLESTFRLVQSAYNAEGGDDKAAKAADLLARVEEGLGEHSASDEEE